MFGYYGIKNILSLGALSTARVNHFKEIRMIVIQKKIRYLILSILSLYIFLYLIVSKFNVIGIEDLDIVIGVSVIVYVCGVILSYIFFNKNLSVLWLIYEVVGFALISFFITSVFVMKIEELFFWHSQKEQHETFFNFAFDIFGWNYILAIPYLILLIIESSFMFNSRK